MELGKYILIFLIFPLFGSVGILQTSLQIPLINNLRGDIQVLILIILYEICAIFFKVVLFSPPKMYIEQEAKIKEKEEKIRRMGAKIRRINNANLQKTNFAKNPNKYQNISESKTDEIDISIKSEKRQGGQVVGLSITNNNRKKPIFCKAIIKKLSWFKEDPIKGNKWVDIETKEFGTLKWHYGTSDEKGLKEINNFKPEFLYIAKFPINMSQQIIVGGILWRFTISFNDEEKEFFTGKYRMQIDILSMFNDTYKKESWFGCVDMPNVRNNDSTWSELEIWECEDVKSWK